MLNLIENGLKNGDTIKLELLSSTSKSKSLITFPNFDYKINRKFTIYFKILHLIYNQLKLNNVVSKRQLYYLDVNLFQNQSIVDNCVDKIADCLGVSIEDLKISASQKGLVYGDLEILTNTNVIYSTKRSNSSTLIPPISLNSKPEDLKITFNNNSWEQPNAIIILEKDAILSGLINNEINAPQFQNSILITGRGFPDRLTKHFIYILTKTFSQIPIYGYFDSDIYGLMIAIDYKFKNFNSPCQNLIIKGASLFPKHFNTNCKMDYFIPLNDRDVFVTISQFQSLLDNNNLKHNLASLIIHMQRSLFLQVKRELQLFDILDDQL